MLGHPAVVAGHGGGDAQGEALLAEQGVAAVARAVGPDLAGLGEVHDVLVLGITRPRHIGLALGQRHTYRMHTWHPVVVGEDVESALAHAGHDAHVDGHVGGVGELHANMGDGGAERAHGERHHIHGASLHGAGVEGGELGAHLGRLAPVVGGTGIDLSLGADVGAVLDAGDIARVGQCEIAVRALGLVQRAERAGSDELIAETLVLLSGTVAPIDIVGLQDLAPLLDPCDELLVGGRTGHGTLRGMVRRSTRVSCDEKRCSCWCFRKRGCRPEDAASRRGSAAGNPGFPCQPRNPCEDVLRALRH